MIAKNIAPDESKLIKEHDLSKLFVLLDSTTQNEIINANNYDKNKFKETLDKHSKAFIEWRYIHEHNFKDVKDADTLFLANLIHSLESIANRLSN